MSKKVPKHGLAEVGVGTEVEVDTVRLWLWSGLGSGCLSKVTFEAGAMRGVTRVILKLRHKILRGRFLGGGGGGSSEGGGGGRVSEALAEVNNATHHLLLHRIYMISTSITVGFKKESIILRRSPRKENLRGSQTARWRQEGQDGDAPGW